MKSKRAVSIVLSVVFGGLGIFSLLTFFGGYRSMFELILGVCLVFLATFNIFAMLKYSK